MLPDQLRRDGRRSNVGHGGKDYCRIWDEAWEGRRRSSVVGRWSLVVRRWWLANRRTAAIRTREMASTDWHRRMAFDFRSVASGPFTAVLRLNSFLGTASPQLLPFCHSESGFSR